jgi:hypothetical protein
MSDFLWDALLAVATLLALVWVFRNKLRQREQRHKGFEQLASDLGLQFNATHMGQREGQAEPAEHAALRETAAGAAGLAALAALPLSRQFSIDGNFDGVRVHIALRQRSGDSAAGHATLLRADITRPAGLDSVAISRSYAVDRVLDRATGGQDIELGDAAFDAQLRLRGAPADAVRAWLASAPLRHQVLTYLHDHDTGSIDEHGVHLLLAGAVSDSARIRPALLAMTALSKALSGRSGAAQEGQA